MIRIHLDALHRGRTGINKIPVFAAIRATPQTRCMGVHGLWIQRVEDKEIHDAAQIEHAPGTSPVVGDIRARHVAGDQHGIGVMRTDGGIEHGPTAARSDDAEVSRAIAKSADGAQYDQNCEKNTKLHRCLLMLTVECCGIGHSIHNDIELAEKSKGTATAAVITVRREQGVIEYIVHVRAEGSDEPLTQVEVLVDAQIHAPGAGTIQQVPLGDLRIVKHVNSQGWKGELARTLTGRNPKLLAG